MQNVVNLEKMVLEEKNIKSTKQKLIELIAELGGENSAKQYAISLLDIAVMDGYLLGIKSVERG